MDCTHLRRGRGAFICDRNWTAISLAACIACPHRCAQQASVPAPAIKNHPHAVHASLPQWDAEALLRVAAALL